MKSVDCLLFGMSATPIWLQSLPSGLTRGQQILWIIMLQRHSLTKSLGYMAECNSSSCDDFLPLTSFMGAWVPWKCYCEETRNIVICSWGGLSLMYSMSLPWTQTNSTLQKCHRCYTVQYHSRLSQWVGAKLTGANWDILVLRLKHEGLIRTEQSSPLKYTL